MISDKNFSVQKAQNTQKKATIAHDSIVISFVRESVYVCVCISVVVYK